MDFLSFLQQLAAGDLTSQQIDQAAGQMAQGADPMQFQGELQAAKPQVMDMVTGGAMTRGGPQSPVQTPPVMGEQTPPFQPPVAVDATVAAQHPTAAPVVERGVPSSSLPPVAGERGRGGDERMNALKAYMQLQQMQQQQQRQGPRMASPGRPVVTGAANPARPTMVPNMQRPGAGAPLSLGQILARGGQ